MQICHNCETSIEDKGYAVGGLAYCSRECLYQDNVYPSTRLVTEQECVMRALKISTDPCPKCRRRKDVGYFVYFTSFGFFFGYRTWKHEFVGCRTCARIRQILATLFTGLFGWWHLPEGYFATAAQITRNLDQLFTSAPIDQKPGMMRKASIEIIRERSSIR